MRLVGMALAGLVLVACSCASVESSADRVATTSDAAAVRGCSFQAFVQSNGSDASRSEVMSALREEAADHGGNVVLLLTNSAGEAFFCAAPPAPTPDGFVAAEMHGRPPDYCPHFLFME